MTMTKPKSRGGTADKVWSIGLAGATCLGLVGLVGARTITEASAADPTEQAISSSGLTQADLDAYANVLDAQSAQLDSYRAQLIEAASHLQVASQGQGVVQPVLTQPAKKRKNLVPRPQAAPQLQAAPQAKTRSS